MFLISVNTFAQVKSSKNKEEIFAVSFYDAMNERLKNNFIKSNENFENCLSLQPENDVVLFKIAQNYFDLKKYDQALLFVKKALDINPDNKWYHFLTVQIALQNGSQKEDVIRMIKTLEPVMQNKYIIQNLYRQIYRKKNKFKNKPVVQQHPKTENLKELLEEKQYEKVLEKGNLLLDEEPDNAQTYLYMAKAALALQKYSEAIDFLDLGIDFVQAHKDILKQYYQIYYKIYNQTNKTKKAQFYQQKLKQI